MPSLIVERDGRFGARARKTHRWLGTFATRADAEAAIERERCARPRRGASRGRRDVKPPSESQVVLLAAEATQRGPGWLGPMILVAAYTGLRLFEVAGLWPEDLCPPVDNDGWRVRVRRGKGGYTDEMSVVFEPALSVLLEARATREPGRLVFLTQVGTAVSRQTMAREFGKVAGRVGFGGTFHALRHFHACWLIDGGATDLDVAAQLRHHDNGELVRRRYGRHRATSAALRRIERAR
jgi:integrase